MLIQSGEISSSETAAERAPSLQLIDAAFEQTDSGTLKNIDQSIGDCLEHLNGLDQALVSNVGTSVTPSFSRLDHVLKQMRSKTAMYLERRGYRASDDTLPNPSETTAQNDLDENGSKIKGPPMNTENQSKKGGDARGCQLSGSITSSREVLKALDMILAYYAQNEPSSPVPLLIKRAKRLVGKSFVDIIRDLSPDALSQVRMVSGDEDQPED
jgi:type VI secretion system protein ImpA